MTEKKQRPGILQIPDLPLSESLSSVFHPRKCSNVSLIGSPAYFDNRIWLAVKDSRIRDHTCRQRRVGPVSSASAGPPRNRVNWWAGAAFQPLVPPCDSETCKFAGINPSRCCPPLRRRGVALSGGKRLRLISRGDESQPTERLDNSSVTAFHRLTTSSFSCPILAYSMKSMVFVGRNSSKCSVRFW